MKVPYSDKIDWGFPRPWGGGNRDSRAIRVYYGAHAMLAAQEPALTRPDTAWVMVEDDVDPAKYDWSFAVGHELWLYPIGFKTTPQTKRLREVLARNHVHRVVQVQGYDENVLKAISAGELLISAGSAKVVHRHKYLKEGEI